MKLLIFRIFGLRSAQGYKILLIIYRNCFDFKYYVSCSIMYTAYLIKIV